MLVDCCTESLITTGCVGPGGGGVPHPSINADDIRSVFASVVCLTGEKARKIEDLHEAEKPATQRAEISWY